VDESRTDSSDVRVSEDRIHPHPKEANMRYKTIVLELLEQRPEILEPFKRNRILLPMLNHFALELKTSHEAWKGRLSQARPSSDPSQIASEALEIALGELENCLPSGLPPDETARCPSTQPWRFSAVTRCPSNGVQRTETTAVRLPSPT